MGIGDEIMASGQARQLFEETGKQVVIVGRRGVPRWFDIWDHNPYISPCNSAQTVTMVNGGGVRPYIRTKTQMQWFWKPYKPVPGNVFLTAEEIARASPYGGAVYVEPNVKANGHTNKAWPFDRWQALVDRSSVPMVQCGPPGTRWLHGVNRCFTLTFREACAVLSLSRAFIGSEGALHHAAAALGVPAVVLWSEFISPAQTGYTTQRNIRHASRTCGSRIPCARCAASMAAISVAEVEKELRGALT